MSNNPHACTARSVPFPVTGGDYVSDGKTLKPASAAKPAPATEPKPAAERGTTRDVKRQESDHG